jgi:hypothetical protein
MSRLVSPKSEMSVAMEQVTTARVVARPTPAVPPSVVSPS